MEEIIGKQNMKIVNDEVSDDLKNDIDEDAIKFNLRKRIRNGGFERDKNYYRGRKNIF